MSFFDTLKSLGLWQQPQAGGAAQPNPYGLDPAMQQQARMASLGSIGSQLLSLSMPLTQQQRAAMMANTDFTGGYQNNLYNAAQMQLLGNAQRRKQAEDDRTRAAQEWLAQKIAGLPDSKQKQNAMIYMQLGDIQKAAEVITAGSPEPKYQIVDGQVVDMNNPLAGARPVPGLQPKTEAVDPLDRLKVVEAYEKTPEVQSYNVLASTINSLSGAVYDDNKVNDLDFVYGVAKALDPTSVVRESEAGMVIDAQGLDAATLGRINSLWGGGALLPEQRLALLDLVRRRAEAIRPLVETRRQNILDVGRGIVDERLIRPISPLAPNPLAPEQSSSPGREDLRVPFPEPELIEVRPYGGAR